MYLGKHCRIWRFWCVEADPIVTVARSSFSCVEIHGSSWRLSCVLSSPQENNSDGSKQGTLLEQLDRTVSSFGEFPVNSPVGM